MEQTPKTRTCTICKKEKELETEFRRQVNGKYGRQSACKPCVQAAILAYRKTPKGKAKYKEYTKRHREKAGYREAHRRYRESPKGLWAVYRLGADKRGLTFDLTVEDFATIFWRKPCTYCGDEIRTLGIDRVDNDQGYTRENVVSCCSTCNLMKLQASKEEFLAKCQQIVRFQRLDVGLP